MYTYSCRHYTMVPHLPCSQVTRVAGLLFDRMFVGKLVILANYDDMVRRIAVRCHGEDSDTDFTSHIKLTTFPFIQ